MKKKLALTLTITLLGLSAMAQNFAAPKKGAKLYVQSTSIEVAEKGATTFDVWLVRSKMARKTIFEDPRAISPAGGSFTITVDPANKDHYTVRLEADDLTTGSYSCSLMTRSAGIHSVTGALLTINIIGGKAVATKDGK